MSRTERVSITTDGPQEMFGPHAGPLLVQIRLLPVEGFWEQAWWGWWGHKLSQRCAYLAPCFQLWLFETTWFTRHLFVLPLLVGFFSGSPLCVRIMQVLLLYKHKLPLFLWSFVCACVCIGVPRGQDSVLLSALFYMSASSVETRGSSPFYYFSLIDYHWALQWHIYFGVTFPKVSLLV